MQLLDFIDGILELAGIDDSPTFTRSKLVNRTEEIQALVSAGMFLDQEYLVTKIMTLLGDKELVKDSLDKIATDDIQRLSYGDGEENNSPEDE
jgi:hypothetical protein